MGGYVNSNILPSSTGLNLGNQNQRWNIFCGNLNIAGGVTGISIPIDATSFDAGDIGAQINAAFASEIGGSIVTFPSSPNPYIAVNQITIPDNCCLYLQSATLVVNAPILVGNNASIIGNGALSILQGDGITGGISSIVANTGLAGMNEGAATPNNNIYLYNFSVDANAGGVNSATNLNAVYLANCTDCTVENVTVTGTYGPLSTGIRSFGGIRNTLLHCTAIACGNIGLGTAIDQQWTIAECISVNNGNNGIDCGIGSSQGRVLNCESTGNSGSGFNPDTTSDIQVIGGNFSNNGLYGIALTNPQSRGSIIGARCCNNANSGIFLNNSSNHISIQGCSIAHNGQHGIFLNASSFCTITGNNITDNGISSPNSYDGIFLQSAGALCIQNVITSNEIKNSDGTTQRYGINESSSGGGTLGENIIALNQLVQSQTSALNNIQSNDQLFGNRVDFTGNIYAPSSLATLSVAGAIVSIDGLTTVSHGVPVVVANLGLTGQGAAISAHSLFTPPVDGMYRVSFYAKVTTPASSSSTLGGSGGFVVNFKDQVDSTAVAQAVPDSTNANNDLASSAEGSAVIYAKGGQAVTFDYGRTSSGGTAMVFYVFVTVEAL